MLLVWVWPKVIPLSVKYVFLVSEFYCSLIVLTPAPVIVVIRDESLSSECVVILRLKIVTLPIIIKEVFSAPVGASGIVAQVNNLDPHLTRLKMK